MHKVFLLDCTLRDGGYLNDWKFGNSNIINIFERLISAGIDIVEVGFIDDRRMYDSDRTIFPNTTFINQTYEKLNKGNSLIVGMIDYGTCGIENIQPCSECFLDGIRVIFKKERMHEAIAFCKEIKELGYKTFAQAVSITSYDDTELTDLVDLVNELEPYAFSLVDTYGLLHKGQLLHYFNFVCEYMKPTIGLGYHAHNNFQLAYANCIELLQNPPENRMVIVDGSLYGMGKSAGNTPIELLTSYMNEYCKSVYHTSQLLEAIEVTILDIRRQVSWGYSFKFFLSASHDCHPNYVNYLMDIGQLSVKSIGEILDNILPTKRLNFDVEYIRNLYLDYQNKNCDDITALAELRGRVQGKKLILLAPGKNIYAEKGQVEDYIREYNPIVIAVNFIPQGYSLDYVFMSNAKRYVQLSSSLSELHDQLELIATSNITRTEGKFEYTFNYGALLDEDAMMPDNPLLMLLRLLNLLDVKSVALAGFDGYKKTALANYVNPNMEYIMSGERAEEINQDTIKGIARLHLSYSIEYITSSLYNT